MYVFLLVAQVVIALLLIITILMQQGRGGGLLESLSGVESMFGAKTNILMVRTTAVLATLFLLNCLALTYISTQRSKSLMETATTIVREEAVGEEGELEPIEKALKEAQESTKELEATESEGLQETQEKTGEAATAESETKNTEEIEKVESPKE